METQKEEQSPSISVQLYEAKDPPIGNEDTPQKQVPLSVKDDDLALLGPGFAISHRYHIDQSHVLDDMSFSYYYHCKPTTQIAHMLTIPVTNFTVTCMLAALSFLISDNKYPEIVPCITWGCLTVWYIYLTGFFGSALGDMATRISMGSKIPDSRCISIFLECHR